MDTEKCAACHSKPRSGFTLTPCSDCKKSFHTKKCLKLISIGNHQSVYLCAVCDIRRRERERERENTRHSSSSTITHTTATKTRNTPKWSAGKAPIQSTSPTNSGVQRVTGSQADFNTITPAVNLSSNNVSNPGTVIAKHASSDILKNKINKSSFNNTSSVNNDNNIKSMDSELFSLNSLSEALDAKFDEFFNKYASLPAGDADFLKNINQKVASLESQVTHQGFLLGHMTLELHELRKTNAELSNEIIRLRSQEACSESINNNNFNNNNNNSMSEMGGNTAPNIQISVNPSSFPPSSPTTPLTPPPLDGSEVVNTGELLITNFIDGEVTDYRRLAHTVLVALDPSISDSDVILARPLSIVPQSNEQRSQPSRRVAVLLSSASLVNRVLLAKTKRTRFCTGDLDLSRLGVELSSRVKACKIFVNEALSKEKFKIFCSLKSAAKGLGIQYVWHRGGRFMARTRGGDRVHVFETLSDLHAIRSASRNKISRPVACDAPRAFEAGESRPTTLGRGSSASEGQ